MKDPQISCCLIVRDEEKHIKGCLESIINTVDEIILVDTGSKDNTVDIAISLGDKVKIFHYTWHDDFAAARNFSLSKAKGSWILYIDADERLNTFGQRNLLRDSTKNTKADGFNVYIRNLFRNEESIEGSFNWAIRFFRNIPGIYFKNAVHEQIEWFLMQKGATVEVAPFIIDHFGYDLDPKSWKEKIKRNLKITLAEVEKRPHDPYILYYLATGYYMTGDKDKAVETIEKAYTAITPQTGNQLKCFIYNFKGQILFENKAYEEVLKLTEISLNTVFRQQGARLLRALAYAAMGKYEEALPHAEFALNFHLKALNPLENPSVLSLETTMPLASVRKLLATCYFHSKRYSNALEVLKEELQKDSVESDILLLGAMSAFFGGKPSEAGNLLNCALKKGVPASEVFPFLIWAEIQNNNIKEALILLEGFISHGSTPVSGMNMKITLEKVLNEIDFFEYPEEASNLFGAIIRRSPWKQMLMEYFHSLASKERISYFTKLFESLSSPLRGKDYLLALLNTLLHDYNRALAVTNSLCREIVRKPIIDEEDLDVLKLHGALLIKTGKPVEAAKVRKLIEHHIRS